MIWKDGCWRAVWKWSRGLPPSLQPLCFEKMAGAPVTRPASRDTLSPRGEGCGPNFHVSEWNKSVVNCAEFGQLPWSAAA
jgi:hypothetical protein